jgi:hypothetical protein
VQNKVNLIDRGAYVGMGSIGSSQMNNEVNLIARGTHVELFVFRTYSYVFVRIYVCIRMYSYVFMYVFARIERIQPIYGNSLL